MPHLLPIMHRNRLAAVVLPDRAIIASDLTAPDRRTVEAMCFYAAEILNNDIPTPYTDDDALAYAEALIGQPLVRARVGSREGRPPSGEGRGCLPVQRAIARPAPPGGGRHQKRQQDVAPLSAAR